MNNKKFVTVHIVNTLPLHNLNRDQSGQPKSQFDGGVQRGRLSAQSLKRAARVAYRAAGGGDSIRTKQGVAETLRIATEYAEEHGVEFDAKKGKSAITKVIKGLTNGPQDTDNTDAKAKKADSDDDKKVILLFSRSELTTLAHAAVNAQHNDTDVTANDCIKDCTSPSLDVAAFGRMFANSLDLGTHAAVAVSHAATTHQMSLVTDYFTAVEELKQDHGGAGHLGLSFYTSGVYYHTFTIDAAQLKRSWSGYGKDGSAEDLANLVRALILALPSGKVNNSNPITLPTLVLAEVQEFRSVYESDTPVTALDDGGYKEGTVKALASARAQALDFAPDNFGESVVAGELFDQDFRAVDVKTIDAVVKHVVDNVLALADSDA